MSIQARCNTDTCSITELFVPAKLRNRGIGSRELSKMEEILRQHGCKYASVYVGPLESGSQPASEFYRKNGYSHDYPNIPNWLTQTYNFPKEGVPQRGTMTKKIDENDHY